MSFDAMPHSHYLYQLSNPETGEFYVGVRTCQAQPDADSYMGSGRWPRSQTFHRVSLAKRVLAVFDSRSHAEEAETLLIDMVVLDRLCQNSLKTASPEFKREHHHLYHRHFGWRKAARG